MYLLSISYANKKIVKVRNEVLEDKNLKTLIIFVRLFWVRQLVGEGGEFVSKNKLS